MKGKFITFEGCEGVGKSTQVRFLKEYMANTNQDCIFLREPGGTDISEDIRKIILDPKNTAMTNECETMLYCAARAQLIKQVIEPALKEGKTVICDRFIDSTFAYQGVARGLGADYVEQLNDLACGKIKPDVTIFLDLSPEQAFERKGGADKNDRLEREAFDFHMKVYEGYKEAAKRHPKRIACIDATSDKFTTQNKIREFLRAGGYIK